MRCARANLGASDSAAAAAAPVAARKARRSKKSCSGVARRSGISQPRRWITCMGRSSGSGGHIDPGLFAGKSQVRDTGVKGARLFVVWIAKNPNTPFVIDDVDISACILGHFLRPIGRGVMRPFAMD